MHALAASLSLPCVLVCEVRISRLVSPAKKRRVARIDDFHFTEHVTNDHFDVLIVNPTPCRR